MWIWSKICNITTRQQQYITHCQGIRCGDPKLRIEDSNCSTYEEWGSFGKTTNSSYMQQINTNFATCCQMCTCSCEHIDNHGALSF